MFGHLSNRHAYAFGGWGGFFLDVGCVEWGVWMFVWVDLVCAGVGVGWCGRGL